MQFQRGDYNFSSLTKTSQVFNMLLTYASFSVNFYHVVRTIIYIIRFLVIERQAKVPIRVRQDVVQVQSESSNQQAVIRTATKASETVHYYPFSS